MKGLHFQRTTLTPLLDCGGKAGPLLSGLHEIVKREGIEEAVTCGQVRWQTKTDS